MTVQEVPYQELSLELLLEADPSREKLLSYLPRSLCFAIKVEQHTVGACAVLETSPQVYELMCIAVDPQRQAQGIGTQLLEYVVAHVRGLGAQRLELGTGTFGYQLAFYQRAGFRAVAVDRDYFLRTYHEPIFEDGIQLKDMLRLEVSYRE